MIVLDKARPFGEVIGEAGGVRFIQDGIEFDLNGKPVDVEAATKIKKSQADERLRAAQEVAREAQRAVDEARLELEASNDSGPPNYALMKKAELKQLMEERGQEYVDKPGAIEYLTRSDRDAVGVGGAAG